MGAVSISIPPRSTLDRSRTDAAAVGEDELDSGSVGSQEDEDDENTVLMKEIVVHAHERQD
jgi:hypothetical protein